MQMRGPRMKPYFINDLVTKFSILSLTMYWNEWEECWIDLILFFDIVLFLNCSSGLD